MLENRKYGQDIFIFFYFIVFAVLYFCFFPSISTLGGDGADGHYAIWAANAKMLHNGEFPLWNQYIWGGYGDVGHIHEVFYPILIILEYVFWDSASQTLQYNIFPAYIALHFAIGCIGMYMLGRARKKTPIVAFTVATLTIISGCFTFGSTWAYIFGSYCWITWLILFLYLLVETGRMKYSILSGVVLAMIGLCASAQGVLFALLIYILVYFVVVWKRRSSIKTCWKLGVRFLLSGVIGMGIASVELIPFLETSLNSYRYVPGIDISENVGKLPLNIFKEDIAGIESIMGVFGKYTGTLSMSFVVLILIVLAMFIKNKEDEWILLFGKIMMIISFLYAIGIGIPDIFWYIPGYNAIREPILYAPFIIMGGGILIPDSLELICSSLNESKKVVWKETLSNCNVCVGIIVLFLIISFLPHIIAGKVDLLIKILVLSIFFVIVFQIKIKNWMIVSALLILVFCNSFAFVRNNCLDEKYTSREATKKINFVNQTSQELIDELDSKVEDGKDISSRYIKWSQTDVLPSNVAAVLGEHDCFAYLNPIYLKTFYVYQLMELPKRVQMQNMRYILMGNDCEESFIDWMESDLGNKSELAETLVYSSYDEDEAKSVRYIDTSNLNLGCGWIANNIIEYRDSIDACGYEKSVDLISRINDQNINLQKDVFLDLDSIDNGKGCSIDKSTDVVSNVECTMYKSNRITYNVETNTEGIFVTTEFYYPGWKVVVDGVKSDLLQVNYAFRGVYLSEGTHTVEYYYFPESLKIGIGLACFAIVLLFACIVLEKKDGEARFEK